MSTFTQVLQEIQNANARIYPTKEEILNAIKNGECKPTEAQIKALNAWRKANKGQPLSHMSLADLININLQSHLQPTNREITVEQGHAYMYNALTKTIYLGTNPSIISTLHEYGHALFGSSELKACAWSIAMFSTVYPRSYAKLEWHGHMLVKAKTEAIKPPTA